MSYPTLEQYNQAFQNPLRTLNDPELKNGSIATTVLGLPLALCGGFALTYTVKSGSKKFAVRCFHKKSNALERRYTAISNRLKALQSEYFVDFEFQPQGLTVNTVRYPVVKMAWAMGITLGEFLEQYHRSAQHMQQLTNSLRALSQFLERQKMAHGDIQPGNVMVADGGRKVQLIDYDGIFVEDLRSLGSSELGHRNFQHPKRSSSSWDPSIDRFSFIGLDLAIRVLQSHPELWVKTQSDGDSILFKANDFADPSRSFIFSELLKKPKFSDEIKNFETICKTSLDKIPTLEDFVARKNMPQIVHHLQASQSISKLKYLSAYLVIDAKNYDSCLNHVGDKVELIGKIASVVQKTTKFGKPYVFINFGPWKGQAVKINVWSDGLGELKNKPDQSWEGKWISVVGLLEPPYVNSEHNYSHLAISITQSSQIHELTEAEAKFRMPQLVISPPVIHSRSTSNNRDILSAIRGATPNHLSAGSSRKDPPKTASNQSILNSMNGKQSATVSRTASPKVNSNSSSRIQTSNKASINRNYFTANAVYMADALETNLSGKWRDRSLFRHSAGLSVFDFFYRIFRNIFRFLDPYIFLKRIVRGLLQYIVRSLRRN